MDMPVAEPSASAPSNTLHASPSAEIGVPSPSKECAKRKKKRMPKNIDVVSLGREESVKPNPPPKAKKPTPKRRKTTLKKESIELSTKTPPSAENPQGEASNPQEGTPNPKRKRAPTNKAITVATTSSEQSPSTEGPTSVQQENPIEAPSSSIPTKIAEEIEKEVEKKLEEEEKRKKKETRGHSQDLLELLPRSNMHESCRKTSETITPTAGMPIPVIGVEISFSISMGIGIWLVNKKMENIKAIKK
ncbi:pollen-specific leucine-rich repeat extensin-like protein 1 [Cryptomeria japonica]|uniref:pollen-specific leucine-rich repeat extensin-like protein 1 n=1 Tax=Cryptomeria japonica TaxID=3369 RepID=UPI0027DA1F1C|nr:pollen-specific leucine-rich repeat extensin-like protein 1 [Cryptomeria japonica]